MEETINFALAGALMGHKRTLCTYNRATAQRVRRKLAALKIPTKIRRMITVKVIRLAVRPDNTSSAVWIRPEE